jgi:hypothetical protein
MWWILIQGPMQKYPLLKTYLGAYENVIWSAWPDDADTLRFEKHVVINDFPGEPGIANLNYQMTTTLGGLKYAKDHGIKNILKIRSDMIVSDLAVFLSCLKYNKLNFLCCHDNNSVPYLIDYLFAGPVETLIDITEDCLHNKTLNSTYKTEFPEARITSSVIKKLDIQQLKDLNFFLSELNSQTDIYWIKNNLYLSSYKNNSVYKIHKTSPFTK